MKRYLLISLVLFSANASSALIKWVDAEGRVHYSDAPPPPDAKVLRAPLPAPKPESESTASSAPGAPKSLAEREAELKKAQQAKKEAGEKAAKAQADADTKKAYCDSLQQTLRTLQSGARMMDVDAQGNRSYVEDAERQRRIDKAQQDFGSNCK